MGAFFMWVLGEGLFCLGDVRKLTCNNVNDPN